ncbi:MAG: 2-oxo acid dehydrogenase subunit E2 [Steroidobacteraceae bacterium]
MNSSVEIRVPDLGNFTDVEVIEVLVTVGASVQVDQSLLTLETEKATMDVPSSAAGTVTEVLVGVGSKVNSGDIIARLGGATATPTATQVSPPEGRPAPAPPPVAAPEAPSQAPAKPAPPPPQGSAAASGSQARPSVDSSPPPFPTAHASPSVRKFARELGVDLSTVHGSGAKGRITHEDVKGHVKAQLAGRSSAPQSALPALPQVDFGAFGEVEIKPLNRVQKISGPRLQAAWVNIPHVTQFDQADITDLEALRAELKDKAAARGFKLTPLAFIMRACIKALQKFPKFNSSLDGAGNLVFKKYLHLGFAADTELGLLVPVIHDADRKDIYELAGALAELSAAAREGKLKAAQMQGGCFTISSLGGIGGTAFTPIINPPEVAILGVSRAERKPVWVDDRFAARLMLPLSLSYDHRVVDGADAARFTSYLAELLSRPRQLVEAVP